MSTQLQQSHYSDRQLRSKFNPKGNISDTDSSDHDDDDDDDDVEILNNHSTTTIKPSKSEQRQRRQQVHTEEIIDEKIPFLQMTRDEINTGLNTTIVSQESAMADISALLTLIKSNRGILEETNYLPLRERIHKRICSGPSGVGKTETIKLLRSWMGMDEMGDYKNQFIHIDGSVYKDITQLNRLTGSGPGYAACETKNSLVDDLIKSILSEEEIKENSLKVRRAEQQSTTTKSKSKVQRQKKVASDKSPVKKKRKIDVSLLSPPPSPPPYILLFIDEIDKAHRDFMTIINGLLEEGQMRSSRGDLFTLPQKTQLIVLFTSNYGDIAIAGMEVRDEHKAAKYVEASMQSKGLAHNSIERFGSHIIFFGMSTEDLCQIIVKKVDTLMKRDHPLTKLYGKIDYTAAIHCITDFIIQISDPNRGIRNSLKHLDDCLTPLLLDAFYTLEELRAKSSLNKGEWMMGEIDTLKLFKETLNIGMFDNVITSPSSSSSSAAPDDCYNDIGLNIRDIINVIKKDVKNRQKLQVFQSDGSNHSIHAFGISRGTNIINCVIVPLIVNHYTITTYDDNNDHSQDEIIMDIERKKLENNYNELKNDYCSVIMAIKNVNKDGHLDHILNLAQKKDRYIKYNNNNNNNNTDDDDDDDESESLLIEMDDNITQRKNDHIKSKKKKKKGKKKRQRNEMEQESDDDDYDDEIVKDKYSIRKCTGCGILYPISVFRVVSGGNIRSDGSRGQNRISTRKICRTCSNRKYRVKKS
jgi:hypothetical protein